LLSLRSDNLRSTDNDSSVRHDLKDFHCVVDTMGAWVPAGCMGIRFFGLLNEGMFRGTMSMDFSKVNPEFVLSDELNHVQMTEQMRPIVENFFPGMRVFGRIDIVNKDLKWRMFNDPPDVPNWPAGKGEMIFNDGQLVGKAAPDWVTNVFPGLNVARYTFVRMHNWFEKLPDGRVHNNMIFRGRPWNLYMEGDSYPDGRVDYTVGVDLLARLDSKYWSEVGQGMVPLFTSKAKIVNGTFEDQEIDYVPEKLIYRLLWKNNVVAAAYWILKKKLVGRKE